MVRRENSLDDVILQIFEDQEDVFHFPVTTQREARAFVKALHLKGVAYEALYTAVEEFEPNFTSWRKGLGKSGIGNRVIERINQPLQDLLLSDGEQDVEEVVEAKHSKVQSNKATFESVNAVAESPNVPQSGNVDKQEKQNSVNSGTSTAVKINGIENATSHSTNHRETLDTNQNKRTNGHSVKNDEYVKPAGETGNSDRNQTVISNDKKLKDNKLSEMESEPLLNNQSVAASNITSTVDPHLSVKNEQPKKDEIVIVESSASSKNSTFCVQERSLDVNQTSVAHLQVKSACNSESDESFVSVGSDMDRAASPQESATVFSYENTVTAQSVSTTDSNNRVLVAEKMSTPMPLQPMMPEQAAVVTKTDESLVKIKANDVTKLKSPESAGTGTSEGHNIPSCQPNVQSKESVNCKSDTTSKPSVVELTKNDKQIVNKNDKTTKTVVPIKNQKSVDKQKSVEGEKSSTRELTKVQASNDPKNLEKTKASTVANSNKSGVVQTNKAKTVEVNKSGVVQANKSKTVEASREVVNGKSKANNTIPVTKESSPEKINLGGKSVPNNQLLSESRPNKNVPVQDEAAAKVNGQRTQINNETLADVNQNVVSQNTIKEKTNEVAPQDILMEPDVFSKKVNESKLGSKDKCEDAEVSIKQVTQSAVNQEPGKDIHKSSTDTTGTPTEHSVNAGQDHTVDDFVILDSAASPADELTSGSWVLEPKPSEIAIEPAVEDEISECYDSDIDMENLDCLPAVRNQLRLLKSTSRLSDVDGSGYVYAFTDSSNDAKNHRIKVGASRQPYKKLQQATLFNVEVKLVSAVRVGSRKTALLDILGQLERYLIVDAKYWFLGPLDDILQILMETCMNYPVQQTPSMPSSPTAVGK